MRARSAQPSKPSKPSKPSSQSDPAPSEVEEFWRKVVERAPKVIID
jgi:hypothetical protein